MTQPDGTAIGLFRIEDMKLGRQWVPAVAMFGGKVNSADRDWRETAAREFVEETGGLLDQSKITNHIATFHGTMEQSVYVPESKYQVMFYPVSPDQHDLISNLPAQYWEAFNGQIVKWSRAATRLICIQLICHPERGWQIAETIDQQGNGVIPIKVELNGALKRMQLRDLALDADLVQGCQAE